MATASRLFLLLAALAATTSSFTQGGQKTLFACPTRTTFPQAGSPVLHAKNSAPRLLTIGPAARNSRARSSSPTSGVKDWMGGWRKSSR